MTMRSLTLILVLIALAACGPSAGERAEREALTRGLVHHTLGNLIFVEGGSFIMGDVGTYITESSFREGMNYQLVDPDHPEAMHLPWTDWDVTDNKPPVPVTLTGYSLSRFEITYGEYDTYTEITGRERIRSTPVQLASQWRTPDRPAAVNWYQARDYCAWLAEVTGLPFGLPTEAQWEYAARSRGKNVAVATDTGLVDAGRNYPGPGQSGPGPNPVGLFPPNPLGFHDMTGHVSEWVYDWYDPEWYQRMPEHDPTGPETGEKKVLRGGYYGWSPEGNTVYSRASEVPAPETAAGLGFRCAVHRDRPVSREDLPRWLR
jgi:formylglycine-generating enzyme